jgi:MOSC domain-containing protein YiiM
MNPTGKLEAIWIKQSHRGPMSPSKQATLISSGGIVGNADFGSERQVTLVEQELWDRVKQGLGDGVRPVMRRANLLLSGTKLVNTRGRVIRVGACRIRIEGETKPCHRMDEAYAGLQEALRPDWGGGAWGVVLDDGVIEVGDEVRWE